MIVCFGAMSDIVALILPGSILLAVADSAFHEPFAFLLPTDCAAASDPVVAGGDVCWSRRGNACKPSITERLCGQNAKRRAVSV